MRATFITTALENGAQLEDVQKPLAVVARARRSCYNGQFLCHVSAPGLFVQIQMMERSPSVDETGSGKGYIRSDYGLPLLYLLS